jgi:hypothetical protein
MVGNIARVLTECSRKKSILCRSFSIGFGFVAIMSAILTVSISVHS